jgi:NAD(P)-dependent dehydrogenase (short-subunit alcohol dehydrogenase family)
MASRTWFITGTSRGLGRVWAEAALGRGDRVAATARDPGTLDELARRFGDAVLPLRLDVTDRAQVFSAVARAHDHFGRLDVVVNGAGYGLFGAIEEASEAEARAALETNLFGKLWVTQAVLPLLRRQGSGHVLQVSSMGGLIAFPTLGIYHAAKWGLEGLSEALAREVADLGIAVTIVEPGGYRTDWAGRSAAHADPLAAYDAARTAARREMDAYPFGDPAATADAILAVVDADDPPLRLFLGEPPLGIVREVYAERLATWEAWAAVSARAQGGTTELLTHDVRRSVPSRRR